MVNSVLFLPGLIALGAVSSYTDFKYGCIKNIHLLFGFFYGCTIYAFLFFSGRLGYNAYFLLGNLAIAAVIAYMLYINQVWSAGDGKLFIVLSFLSPWFEHALMFRLPALSLLINIGIFSLLYMLVFDCKIIFSHLFHLPRQEIIETAKFFAKSLITVFSVTWIVWFLFSGIRTVDPLILFVVMTVCYCVLNLLLKWFGSFKLGLFIFMLAGLGLRFYLEPEIFLSPEKMLNYLAVVLRLTIFFSILNMIFFKSVTKGVIEIPEKDDEKAFAPIIFFGSLSLQVPLAAFVVTIIRG